LEENVETVDGGTVLKIMDQSLKADQANVLSVYVTTDIYYLIKWVSFSKEDRIL
jgi:hypothetical protein